MVVKFLGTFLTKDLKKEYKYSTLSDNFNDADDYFKKLAEEFDHLYISLEVV